MDAALIAVTGICAIIQRRHVSLSLAGVSFFGAVTGSDAFYAWRVVRIVLVLLSVPLSLFEVSGRPSSAGAYSSYLSFLAIGLAAGESSSAGNFYPFLVFFVCLAVDFAIGKLKSAL